MTIAEIDKILSGKFENPADRKYWEDKKAELIRKKRNFAENEANRRRLSQYNR